jgi:hypothetical protein
MKTAIAIVVLALGVSLSASAQKVVRPVPRVYPRSQVVVGVGGGWGWGGPGFYRPWGYNPWYGYPPAYAYPSRPSKLDLEIQDIQNDYKDRIWSARHDESLSRKERRKLVHDLKYQRDKEILQTKKDYYKK